MLYEGYGVCPTKTTAAPTRADITFPEKNSKTTVMVNHLRIQTRAEADGIHAAGSDALDRLKALLEK